LASARVVASNTTRSGPARVETRTHLPSGENFSRLAPRMLASRRWTTFLLGTSTIAMLPSCASAAQSSRPFEDTSNPSVPLPTATSVCSQSLRVGAGRPGGCGDGPGTSLSRKLSVPELTLDVMIVFVSADTTIM
jgi:hypothetical protein